MRLLVVVAPARFRDEELFEPLDEFRKKGIETTVVSTRAGTCIGMLGGTVDAKETIKDQVAASFDGIVVVGGNGSPEYLWNHEPLIRLVQDFYGQKKVIGAICLAPVVLAQAGVLKGRDSTVFVTPDSRREMEKGGATLKRAGVVSQGHIITADGPASARAFAKAIIVALQG